MLLLSTRYDPATPHRNAVRVHDLQPNSARLNVDGVGHGALPFSSCAQQATAQYLLTGRPSARHRLSAGLGAL